LQYNLVQSVKLSELNKGSIFRVDI